MKPEPTFDQIFAVMSAASVGDTAARVPVSDTADLDDIPTQFAIALNLLLDDLAFRIEERRRADDQLRHAQKMQGIGRLAGGVAHDFNNLVSVIVGFADVILLELKEDDPLRGYIESIKLAGLRASDLTNMLLAFSRQQALKPAAFDLNDLLKRIESILRRLVGDDINFSITSRKPIGTIYADPGQIEQVVMNLIVNARDAMPNGGKLTIEVADTEVDSDYALQHPGVIPGPHVMLAVTDTGIGMNAATREHIFEPFFTTKAEGQGTGLGLATAFGIVDQSGGHIWVYSEPGRGTTFKIYFPRSDRPVDQIVQEQATELPRGSETVLLAEDDEQVRSLVETILTQNGYTVFGAPSGDEALRISEQHAGTIDLLLVDAVMPRMSGRELAEHLSPVRPNMRVLYMSGFPEEFIAGSGSHVSSAGFIQKPITPSTLLPKVREILNKPG